MATKSDGDGADTTEAPTEGKAPRCSHPKVKALTDKAGKPTMDTKAFANSECVDCGARVYRG